jgi:hypothetical protein
MHLCVSFVFIEESKPDGLVVAGSSAGNFFSVLSQPVFFFFLSLEPANRILFVVILHGYKS